jgi:hypothetical protein
VLEGPQFTSRRKTVAVSHHSLHRPQYVRPCAHVPEIPFPLNKEDTLPRSRSHCALDGWDFYPLPDSFLNSSPPTLICSTKALSSCLVLLPSSRRHKSPSNIVCRTILHSIRPFPFFSIDARLFRIRGSPQMIRTLGLRIIQDEEEDGVTM